ncbi:YezD family protein [Methylomonas sp. SURF-1]|uniref:YezD family protein n=1 Tax=Methylomonas aurea TaxID=2952224 RepID=A0ABT1UCR7_9GAMM|nr:YezD family protein [Methylomonas sp. SURF-1]MCQ8179935.1 YezD family protein [Methylomonas sp. SURF-1]
MDIQFETEHAKSAQQQELVQQIVSILQGLRFGSVEIVVHDGRVVQIEKHEKFRVKTGASAH